LPLTGAKPHVRLAVGFVARARLDDVAELVDEEHA